MLHFHFWAAILLQKDSKVKRDEPKSSFGSRRVNFRDETSSRSVISSGRFVLAWWNIVPERFSKSIALWNNAKIVHKLIVTRSKLASTSTICNSVRYAQLVPQLAECVTHLNPTRQISSRFLGEFSTNARKFSQILFITAHSSLSLQQMYVCRV